jgi:nucleoside-diphosphate-sugar epimerase
MLKILICGAGGFIGAHLARRLAREGAWVRGVDLQAPEFAPSAAHEFVIGDLRDRAFCAQMIDQRFDEIYQLAADMGGAGYIFTGDNDADVMHNSATINLNVVDLARRRGAGRLFYSSSACIYPERNQLDPDRPDTCESSAYPAAPDSEYGWEKLWSERVYLAFHRNHGVPVRIARFHNVFGPEGAWRGGREKSPAAICRKVAEARDGDAIEIWGDGSQTRSFLYIDECLEGVRRLVDSDFTGPVNIGSAEKVSIDQLASLVIAISGKRLGLRHVPGPQGVRGRSSDNRLARERLRWEPTQPLRVGLEATYAWVERQVESRRAIELQRR